MPGTCQPSTSFTKMSGFALSEEEDLEAQRLPEKEDQKRQNTNWNRRTQTQLGSKVGRMNDRISSRHLCVDKQVKPQKSYQVEPVLSLQQHQR